MAKKIFYFDCMDCGEDWEQKLDEKSFLKELKAGDISSIGDNGGCPKCHSGDIAIGNEDGETFNGSKFESKTINLKRVIEGVKKVDEKFDLNDAMEGEISSFKDTLNNVKVAEALTLMENGSNDQFVVQTVAAVLASATGKQWGPGGNSGCKRNPIISFKNPGRLKGFKNMKGGWKGDSNQKKELEGLIHTEMENNGAKLYLNSIPITFEYEGTMYSVAICGPGADLVIGHGQ